MKGLQFILGSQSPRRKELLSSLGVSFELCLPHSEETTHKKSAKEQVLDLAQQKGREVFQKAMSQWERPFVLTADTLVELDKKVLGKPKNLDEAKEMLLLLSGKTHQVHTGVTLLWKGGEKKFLCTTQVCFAGIDAQSLKLYLESHQALDKAGAYGIQGMAQIWIESIQGSYSNVVGLPLCEVRQSLIEFSRQMGHSEQNWRAVFV